MGQHRSQDGGAATARLVAALNRHGPLDVLRIGLDTPRRRRAAWREWRAERDFDARHGVDTAGQIELSQLAIDSPDVEHGVQYQPVRVDVFRASMNRLHFPLEERAFVDYGSGKGKALLLASELPFKRAVGVEFSPELHRAAERNIAAFRSRRQRCADVRSVCLDAAEFEVPRDDLVLYFYNPFAGPVMNRVLERVRASVTAHPREVTAVVEGPDSLLDVFQSAGYELRWCEPSRYDDSMWQSDWASMEFSLRR
jgi:hypothetical protein